MILACFMSFVTAYAFAPSLPLSGFVSLIKFGVWAPRIAYPTDDTVWIPGQYYRVTWDTSNSPASRTNPDGQLFLAENSVIIQQHKLASDVKLQDGQVRIQAPYVPTGSSYQVVLVRESGRDFSANFTIDDDSSREINAGHPLLHTYIPTKRKNLDANSGCIL